MARGPQAKALTPGQIERLRRYMLRRRLHVEQLKLAMAAPFHWRVLSRALQGNPVTLMNHAYIVAWLDRVVPEQTPSLFDGKSAAAGDAREADPLDTVSDCVGRGRSVQEEIDEKLRRGSR